MSHTLCVQENKVIIISCVEESKGIITCRNFTDIHWCCVIVVRYIGSNPAIHRQCNNLFEQCTVFRFALVTLSNQRAKPTISLCLSKQSGSEREQLTGEGERGGRGEGSAGWGGVGWGGVGGPKVDLYRYHPFS